MSVMDTHSTKAAADSALPREAIRQLRKRSGLTLSDMSERTGLTISTISKLERGRISLSYDKLMLLSKALGVDIAQLLQPAPQGAAGAQAAVGRQEGMNGGGRRVVVARATGAEGGDADESGDDHGRRARPHCCKLSRGSSAPQRRASPTLC